MSFELSVLGIPDTNEGKQGNMKPKRYLAATISPSFIRKNAHSLLYKIKAMLK